MKTENITYKLIVLYLLKNSSDALSTSQISEYVLDQLDINYFELQQAITELTQTGLILLETQATKSFYTITEEGKSTLSYFEKDLPDMLKKRLLDYLREEGLDEKGHVLATSDIIRNETDFLVHCQIQEDKNCILEIKMTVPTAETAKAICQNWAFRNQQVYNKLMEELL